MTLNISILIDFFFSFFFFFWGGGAGGGLKLTCIGKLLVDPFSKQSILYFFTKQLTLQIRESKFQTANKVGKYFKCQRKVTSLAYSSLCTEKIQICLTFMRLKFYLFIILFFSFFFFYWTGFQSESWKRKITKSKSQLHTAETQKQQQADTWKTLSLI